LLTKGALGESNTRYAQGGLAAAVGPDDTPELHLEDTLVAGADLCDPDAVRALVEGAPEAVAWLVSRGASFDAGDDGLPCSAARPPTAAAASSTPAATPPEPKSSGALVARVREDPAVDVFAGAFALDLLVQDGRCRGIVAQLAPDAPLVRLEAAETVVAAGGAGQLWATTSNPVGATADGLAMGLRAGVAIADPEFVQFHPTVLALPGSAPFLVTEAIRGEGAFLRAADGVRFMEALHPLAELAPRDVVARGIQRQMGLDGNGSVSLDLRHLDPATVRRRFPTIHAELATHDLDLASDLIPVAPAAHYFVGGLVAGADGQTSVPGLTALGEAACSGVHGANRLASNSLLEGLVFGLAAADRIRRGVAASAPAADSSRFLSPSHAAATRLRLPPPKRPASGANFRER
jgi:L-aspartate oxidase